MSDVARNDHPLRLYAQQMVEVKRRIEMFDHFISSKEASDRRAVFVESACLQLRKILELIAFATLCANKKVYSEVHSNFATHWNAELLLRDLARVNPNFYPIPKIETRSENPKASLHLADLTANFLDKDDFIFAYKKCGAMMHAKNPFASKIGTNYYEKMLPIWREKIARLLNNHTIRVLGHPGFWLIHMQEAGDNEVHFYEFMPL